MPGTRRSIKLWPLALLVFLACSAANFAGGLLGLIGAFLHAGPHGSPSTTTGILVGGGAGLAAGAAWCAAILRSALAGWRRAGRASPRIVAVGIAWGAGLATPGLLALGAALWRSGQRWDSSALLMGLGAGLAVGAVYGLLFGLLAWAAAAMAGPR